MNGITLGIDLATAAARCVALDIETGALLASADQPLPQPVRSSDGSSVQRPDYAVAARQLVTRVCVALGARAGAVTALSITGTSGTVVPCDDRGVPVASTTTRRERRGLPRPA